MTTGAGSVDVLFGADTAQFESAMSRAAATAEREMQRSQRAAQAMSKDLDKSVTSIQRQIDTFGMSGAQIQKYNLALKGASDQQLAMVDRLERMKDAQAAFNQQASGSTGVAGLAKTYEDVNTAAGHAASGTAGITRELLVLAHEASQGNFKRFGGSLLVLAEYSATAQKAIAALAGPIGIVAAAVGVFALAAFEGAKQMGEFNKSLVLTGNYAGLTADGFQVMSKRISDSAAVTVGSAKTALMGLVATGDIGPQLLEKSATAVTLLAKNSDKSADEIVKDFNTIAEAPAKWAEEHNKAWNFINADQYAYIQQLELVGDKQGAAAFALDALNEHLRTSASFWDRLKIAVSGAWDEMLGNGQPDTVESKLASLAARQKQITDSANAQRKMLLPGQSDAGISAREAAAQAATAEQIRLVKLGEAKTATDALAKAEELRANKEQIAALDSKKRWEEETKGISLVNQKLQEYRDKTVKPLAGTANAISPAEQAATEASIRRRYAAPGSLSGSPLDLDLEGAKKAIDQEGTLYATRERTLKLYYSNGLIDETDYYQDRTAVQSEYLQHLKALFEAEQAILQARIRSTSTTDQRIKFQKELIDLQNQYNKAVTGVSTDAADDQITRAGKRQQESAKLSAASAAAIAKQIEAQEQVNKNEEAAADQVGKTKQQIEGENIARLELTASLQAQRIETMKMFDFGSDEIVQQQVLLDLQQRDITLKKQALAASTSFGNGSTLAFTKYQESAQNASQFAEQFVGGSLSRLEDSIVKFAETGKLNFGDLFQFMADEFIRQQARMLVASATTGGSSGSGWLGTALTAIGGILGIGAGEGMGAGSVYENAQLPTAGGRAAGGPVDPGAAYLVGERGPEILRMGNVGGMITPNGGSTVANDGGIHITQTLQIGAGVNRAELAQALDANNRQLKGELQRQKNRQTGVFRQ